MAGGACLIVGLLLTSGGGRCRPDASNVSYSHVGACGHAARRISESDATHQRKNALGVGPQRQ